MHRWYSGKYDSVKQKRVIDKIGDEIEHPDIPIDPERELYLGYTASLRIEMLIYGTVIVTDSQWYDGTYFSRLTDKEREYRHFKELLYDEAFLNGAHIPLLEIKRRAGYMASIYGKEFEFSSLPGISSDPHSVSYFVKQFGKENQESLSAHPDFDFYFRKLKEVNPDSSFKDQLERFEERTRMLDRMPPHVFSTWSEIQGIPQSFSTEIEMEDHSRKTRKEMLKTKYLDKWCQDAPSEVLEKLTELETKIRKELEKNYPNRTLIKGFVDDSKNYFYIPLYDEFMNHFNLVYNIGFTIQHNCDLLDIADISDSLVGKNKPNNIDMQAISLPPEFQICIGRISWQDFGEFLCSPSILNARKNWMEQYQISLQNISHDNKEKASESLQRFLHLIMSEFRGMANGLINQNEIEAVIDVRNGKMLIGGSSDLEHLIDNEFCIYFDTPGRDTISRFRTTHDDIKADTTLGTIGASDGFFVNQSVLNH